MTVDCPPRAELAERVRRRRAELEGAIMGRIEEALPAQGGDGEYAVGLRAAVAAAVEHALLGVELGAPAAQAPVEVLVQARRAARSGVSLDTMLRRYVLGSAVLSDCLIEEADRAELTGGSLRETMGVQAVVLTRLLTEITEEYRTALTQRLSSRAHRRADLVQRLLAGEWCPDTTGQLGYALEGWHVGVVAIGSAPTAALGELAGVLETRLLCVERSEHTAWGWLGAGREIGGERLARALARVSIPDGTSLALGEPARALEGWRLTHRQAQAASRVAFSDPRPLTRYADVALLAAALDDSTLSRSLEEIYLTPLSNERDGGVALRATLRAYFSAGCNASSAASALGVARHTVENRLRTAESKLGHTLGSHQAELEVALRIQALRDGSARAPLTLLR
jgi:PucR C-terminal helix-turn-helix domain